MFVRSELKEKAKANFRKNLWVCIGVTLVYTFLTGNFFGLESDLETGAYYFRVGLGTLGTFNLDFIYLEITGAWVMIISLIALLYTILLISPLNVGHARYYIENRIEASSFETLFSALGAKGYWNIVKIILLESIYILLWSLPAIACIVFALFATNMNVSNLLLISSIVLLILPIMKSYQYRMIPYILAENPTMDSSEVFEITKVLTKGNRWNLFVLDLSFILWTLLSTITLGIAGLYVNVYVNATNVEAYYFLKNKAMEEGVIEPDSTQNVEVEDKVEEEVEYVEPTIDDLH